MVTCTAKIAVITKTFVIQVAELCKLFSYLLQILS